MLRRLGALSFGSTLVILLAAAFLVVSFFPWQRICLSTGTDTLCGNRVAWHGFGIVAGLLAAGLLVWELMPVLLKVDTSGAFGAFVTGLLSAGLVVFTLAKLIKDNEFQRSWAWVGFVLSLLVAGAALLRFRTSVRRGARPG